MDQEDFRNFMGENPSKEGTSSTSGSGNLRQYINFSGDSAPEPSSSSSWSGSWIERWLFPEVSSSAPNEGGQPQGEGATSQPTGVMEQAGPSQIAPPGPSSTGLGTAEQQAFHLLIRQEEVKKELLNFLRAHTKIEPKFNFVAQLADDLQIKNADLHKLSKLKEIMDTLRECDIKSGSEAAKHLKASLSEWEKNGRP